MEKKGQSRFPRDGMCVKKYYRIKRNLPGFILVLMMQLFINHASVAQNVTISVKNVDMKSLIKIIEKQTQLGFLYNELDVIQLDNISLDVKNVDVKEVLDLVFKGTSLVYKINKETILISSGKKVSRDSTQKEKFVLKGVVMDGKKIPLLGVTVMVKGTTFGVSTDKDGKYSIQLADPEKTILSFTFIGMKGKEVAVKGEKVLNVVLEEDMEQLEDVIVTGYQKVRKNELTGAAFSVKAENIMQPHMFSVDAMLQGQLPGMHVINPSSTPGVSPKIRIRGESSISGNREPLWVVDGRVLEEPINVSASELNSLDAVNFIGNAISFINPDDIERIDVLMDAAATAIYGVRAANGVIVITTKKGEPGPPRVSYSTSVAFQRRSTYKDMRLMNSKERTEVSEEMHERGLRYNSFTPSIIGYEAALKDLWERKINEEEFAQRVKEAKETNTDWYDLLMHDRINHRHTLALSGGGSDMRYRVSLGYQDNGDAVREVEHSQYTLNASLSNRFSKGFDMSLALSMALSDDKRPYEEVNPLLYAYETSRVLPAYHADGSLYFYNWESTTNSEILYGVTDHIQYNIFNEYKYTGDERLQQNYSASLDWNWEIITGLRVTGKYSYSVASVNIDQWTEERSASAQHMRKIPWNIPNLLDDPDFVKFSELPYGGIFKYDRRQNRSYNLKHSVSYAKTLADKHNLSLYLGTEVASIAYTGLKETRRGYYRDRGHQFVEADQTRWIEYAHRVSEEPLVITDNLQNTFSAYMTFAYTYDSKYILNANIRVDGSNAFGQNKSTRFLPVWSVSGRWNLEREKFIEALGFVNEFALKASYGWQGNVHPDGVPFIVAWLGPLDDRSQEHISTISKFPNDKLTWERTASSNFGVSFSLFDDLLAVSGDYFLRVGKKQLVSQKVDPSNGLEQISINGGDVRNKGYSIAVSVKPIRRDDLSWIFSFTTSHTVNKVENSGVRNDAWGNYLDGSLVRNGASLNTFYSYRFDGLNNKGIPTFEGLSLKHGAHYANLEEALAHVMVKSGRRIAPLSGGINTSFRYKRLSFSASFAFNVGNKVRLNPMFGAMIQTLPTPIKNMTVDFVDRWKKPGDELHTVIPALSNEEGLTYNITPQVSNSLWQMYDNSNIRVVPGDFLKCNSMSLSYLFNPEKLKRIGLKTLNVSVAVDKPFVIKSKKLKGRDPEQLDLSSGAMPQLRGYSFSLSTSF